MKNILASRYVKRCICYPLDEYIRLIKYLLGSDVNIIIDNFTELYYERCNLYYENCNDEDKDISSDEIKAALDKHFDINVTSIHLDKHYNAIDISLVKDYRKEIGVWIAYNESLDGMVDSAKQVLIDNGIKENKTEEVLQRIITYLTI